MIFYHSERNIWLDTNAIQQTITELNELTRMKDWLARTDRDPIPRFELQGWQLLQESEPQYKGEPLTGERVRDIDGEAFAWFVDGVRWNNSIDTVEQQRLADEAVAQAVENEEAEAQAEAAALINTAKAKVRALIDGSVEQSKVLTISYTLPAGSTLNTSDASGVSVDIWLIHPELSTYWTEYQAMFAQRTPFENEEFDTVQGRVTMPGSDLPSVFTAIAVAGSQYRIAWRRLEAAFKACTTATDYDNLFTTIMEQA